MVCLLTCEHASASIPASLAPLFQGEEALLSSHRGFDPGAKPVYEALRAFLRPAYAAEGAYSRLVIELNRSEGHPSLFSSFTRSLPTLERKALLEGIWRPYREETASFIRRALAEKPGSQVLHLSIHSFTPVLDGIERNAEIGLLYDPSRQAEKVLAQEWQLRLCRANPNLRVRLNYPYRGNADGHTTALRRQFGPRYLGFEIEMKQDWLSCHDPEEVARLLAESLPNVEREK